MTVRNCARRGAEATGSGTAQAVRWHFRSRINADFRSAISTLIFDESGESSTEFELTAVSVEPENLAISFVERCFAEDRIARTAINYWRFKVSAC